MIEIVPCSNSDGKKGTQELPGGVINGTGGKVCRHWVPPGVDPKEWDEKQEKKKK